MDKHFFFCVVIDLHFVRIFNVNDPTIGVATTIAMPDGNQYECSFQSSAVTSIYIFSTGTKSFRVCVLRFSIVFLEKNYASKLGKKNKTKAKTPLDMPLSHNPRKKINFESAARDRIPLKCESGSNLWHRSIHVGDFLFRSSAQHSC